MIVSCSNMEKPINWKPSDNLLEFDFVVQKTIKQETYIAIIDSERTGESLFTHWTNNIGIVVKNLATNEIVGELNLNVAPFVDAEWCKEKLKNFWEKYSGPNEFKALMLSESDKIKIEPIKVCIEQLVTFLIKWNDKCKNNLIIGCDHPEVDIVWINFYLNICGHNMITYLFGSFRPVISIFSYNMGLSLTSLHDYASFSGTGTKNFNGLEAVYKRFGIPWRNHGDKHHMAIDDATRIAHNVSEVERYIYFLSFNRIINSFADNARLAFHFFANNCIRLQKQVPTSTFIDDSPHINKAHSYPSSPKISWADIAVKSKVNYKEQD